MLGAVNRLAEIVILVAIALSGVVVTGCCPGSTQGAGSPAPRSWGKPLSKMRTASFSDGQDHQLIEDSTTVLNGVLLGNIDILTSAEAPVDGVLMRNDFLLLTFRVHGDPLKGAWPAGGILLEDWSHQTPSGYDFYQPKGVYRIYLQGSTVATSQWIKIAFMKSHP